MVLNTYAYKPGLCVISNNNFTKEIVVDFFIVLILLIV